MNIRIIHDKQIVSFAHIDRKANLFTYYFELNEGKLTLHSIDKWVKNGKTGNTYKHEEIYHYEYKNWILLENGDYGKPVVPEEVLKSAECYRIGYLQSCL